MPIAIMARRRSPSGSPTSVFIAPDVSALFPREPAHAICGASQPISRWTIPYAIRPTRARNSSDLLLDACSALSLEMLASMGGARV